MKISTAIKALKKIQKLNKNIDVYIPYVTLTDTKWIGGIPFTKSWTLKPGTFNLQKG